MYPKSALQYKQMSAETLINNASPHRLIQMLMAGALEKINYAKGHMERKNIPEKGRYISQVTAIVAELQASLDMSLGGELAENLYLLYDYMTRRLFDANVKNDPAILDEVAALIIEIKAGWDAIPKDVQEASREQLLKEHTQQAANS